MGAKTVGESRMKTWNIYLLSKVSPHNIFTNYKGKKSNLIIDISSSHLLIKYSKLLNLMSNGTNGLGVSAENMQ